MSRRRGIPSQLAGGICLSVAGVFVCLSGCQFFPQAEDLSSGLQSRRTTLPPLRADQEAIQLDVLMIDRRADDPLIGDRLWHELDQVGAVSAETRNVLNSNGLRVGHAASSPPPMLESLLAANPRTSEPSRVSGRTYSIRSGTDLEVQASELWPECDVSIFDKERVRNMQFDQVRGVFHVKPIRLQDGWVRVEFIPEIHHGDLRLRHVATESGFANKTTQEVEKCFPQRFTVTLNVGESAVITADADSEGTLGDRFFRRKEEGEPLQRLLIVRLVDMGRTIKPVDR
ncbi:MAG: hypothetical protein U0872_06430 [Planctomycetaceae bacterium]